MSSLLVQWLNSRAPHAGGLGSTPGQGTRSHMPQLKNPHTTIKMEDHAAIKTQQSLINELIFLKKHMKISTEYSPNLRRREDFLS